jgi:hypothetical protein
MSQDYNLVQGQGQEFEWKEKQWSSDAKSGALLGLSHQRMERITPRMAICMENMMVTHWNFRVSHFQAMGSVGSHHDHCGCGYVHLYVYDICKCICLSVCTSACVYIYI